MRGSRKNIIREIYLRNLAAKASLRGISLRALSYQLSEYRLAGRLLPAFAINNIGGIMKAYITLLSTPSYLDGVLALHQSLIETGARYPFYVGVTSNIPPDVREILFQKKISIIELNDFSYNEESKAAFSAWGTGHWFYTAAKIRIFGLTEFKKLVYLDSDTVVLKNIDHLFDRLDGTAAKDSPMVIPDAEHEELNSGVLVIEPSKEKEEKLISLAKQFPSRADQDLIRMLYKNWKNNPELHLPQEYNIWVPYVDKYQKSKNVSNDYVVLHFIGSTKPFMRYYERRFSPIGTKEYYEDIYYQILFRAHKSIKS